MFIFSSSLFSQKWCNYISTAWYGSVLEKENGNARQDFLSKFSIKEINSYGTLLTSKDSPCAYEQIYIFC